MLSLTFFVLLLLASPALSASPRAVRGARNGKAPRYPTRYGKINTNFVRRAGAAAPGQELAGAPVNNITITPSNVVQCATANIAWTGAVEPVSLSIGQGGFYVGITPITTLSSLTGGSTTWEVNQASGESLVFEIKDANGAVGYIQNIPVGASGDASCVVAASSSWSGSASATATVSSTPVASASSTSSDDGDDDSSSSDDSAASTAAPASSVTPSSTSTKASTTSVQTSTSPVTMQTTTSPTPGGTLGGAGALAGALSASASATATSGSSAMASTSLLALLGGLMTAVSVFYL